MLLPVGRNGTRGTGNRLIERVVPPLGERRSAYVLLGPVVVEPVLPGLEALDHGVPGLVAVRAGVLTGGVVAAADVTAGGAPAEVKPPAG